ncbi:unnamed protein product [Rotaria sordida]|uniref:Uncharacterized protein n=1 Tax=Rotaria sordida TaxID=392033 RepID=A0A814T425_9BILA|nr:unnamed protein product [Rotaria sordida]CAF3944851.1 unnamed protein product [Rotaria sordida]
MKILVDSNNIFQRFIDSTNKHHHQIQQQTEDSPIHIPYQYQTLPPAEFLRSHWIELYNELHKNNET